MMRYAYWQVISYFSGILRAYKDKSVRLEIEGLDSELKKIREEMSRPISQREGYSVWSHAELDKRRRGLSVKREILARKHGLEPDEESLVP